MKAKVKITEVATNKVPLNLDEEWYKGGGEKDLGNFVNLKQTIFAWVWVSL